MWTGNPAELQQESQNKNKLENLVDLEKSNNNSNGSV